MFKINRSNLTKETLADFCKERGFEYGGNEVPELFESNPRIVKMNIVDLDSDSGNGEGVWVYIRNEDDLAVYNRGIGEYEVVLLNDPLSYNEVLCWGVVLVAEGRCEERPILSPSWFSVKLSNFEKLK